MNVTLALREVPAQSIDLVRACGGSPSATLRKVRFPGALPALFASLRIAAPLALVGALLAEYDPLLFGPGLVEEYELCRTELGLTDAAFADIARASLSASGAAEADRIAWCRLVDDWLAAAG